MKRWHTMAQNLVLFMFLENWIDIEEQMLCKNLYVDIKGTKQLPSNTKTLNNNQSTEYKIWQ